MAAVTAPARVRLTVIKGGRPADDWRLEEAQAELAARRSEELAMAGLLFPLLQQAKVAARQHSRAEFQVIAAIDHLLARHAARWAEDKGRAA